MYQIFWAVTLSACGLAGLTMASPAMAQQPEGDCGTSQTELFRSIAGTWTFKQSAGTGLGAVVPFPMPAHSPQSVKVEIDKKFPVAFLKHDGQEIAMIPVPDGFRDGADLMFSEKQKDEMFPARSECGWGSIPTVVGSTAYELIGPARSPELFAIHFGSSMYFACLHGEGSPTFGSEDFGEGRGLWYSYSTEGVFGAVDIATGQTRAATGAEGAKRAKDKCGTPDVESVKVGDMVMTLVVRFASDKSASGYIDFRGTTKSRKPVPSLPFAARAPITLSR